MEPPVVTVACTAPHHVLESLSFHDLSAEEQHRAARIRHRGQHDLFVAGRLLARHALSAASGRQVGPQDWRFRQDAHGKPRVSMGLPDISFSVAHVTGMICVATSRQCEVGIDLERADEPGDAAPVFEMLTHKERAAVGNLDDVHAAREFRRIWAGKEAVAKALGLGGTLDFRDIEIELRTGGARLPAQHVPEGMRLAAGTSVQHLDGDDYFVALACLLPAALPARPVIEIEKGLAC